MKIRASVGSRRKGGIYDEGGVGRLQLWADTEDDRKLLSAIYRMLHTNPYRLEGATYLRELVKSFPLSPKGKNQ